MPNDSPAALIGFVGVALLLGAFLANVLHLLRVESPAYMGLNFVGAALACYSSWLIPFMPFVVLEGVWAAVALGGLALRMLPPRPPS